MTATLGIDLGTTLSLVCTLDAVGRPQLVPTRDGSPRLRSVVHVGEDAVVTVGERAQRLATLDPDTTFAFFKRAMGTDWWVEAGGRQWTPEELSAEVLRALVEDAEAALGARPGRAVITIPAYFGDDARRATQRAAAGAGVETVALLHEPTAACLAQPALEHGTVLVYDLGGGTFDVSVVRRTAAGAEVLATRGDHRLGGADWDHALAGLVAERIEADTGADPRDDPLALALLEERAREAKHALSRLERTAVTLPGPTGVSRVEVDRAAFWQRSAALIERTRALVEEVVEDVGGAGAIDAVLLVGGSVRMPPCAQALRAATGKEPRLSEHPDEIVAIGAALAARDADASGGAARRIRDVTAHALGFVVVSADGSRYVNEVMLERNAPIPAAATKRHRLGLDKGDTGTLDIYMLQGAAERPLENAALGRWTFAEVPGRRGSVDVDVSYHYDVDGVVHVSAGAGGRPLAAPSIDRTDRDLRWTEEDPRARPRIPDLAVALVIDVSGSMSGRSLVEAKKACIAFVKVLEDAGVHQRVALVTFGSGASCRAEIGSSPVRLLAAIASLHASGGTDMLGGLTTAHRVLSGSQDRRVAVVLTDGMPNDPEGTLRFRDRMVAEGIEIIARGVTGANRGFLKRLSSGDGELIGVGDLGAGFRGIAQQLTRSANGLRSRGA